MASPFQVIPRKILTKTIRFHHLLAFAQRPTRTFSIISRMTAQTNPTRGPPSAPEAEASALSNGDAPTYLGTAKRLPEFNLVDKVVLVSGAARGLGLVQAEALLEAGAIGKLI